MKPLVIHGGLAGAVFWVAAGAWALGEATFAIRTTLVTKGRRDPSIIPLSLATYGAVGLAVWATYRAPDLALPGPGWWPVAAGLGLLVAGIWIRVWAIRELGRFFTYAVVVHEGHTVVDTGPYRRVRHPSYTGLLMAMLGLGLGLGTWLSIPVCLVPPLAGFSWRLVTEERVLAAELGEPYRAYMRRTRRLVPGVW
jgi:protein-S-isoprenylcysteine O-methyltransferase